MENIFVLLVAVFGICFLFGVVYPAMAILFYPVYKLFVEDIGFFEYIRSL